MYSNEKCDAKESNSSIMICFWAHFAKVKILLGTVRGLTVTNKRKAGEMQ